LEYQPALTEPAIKTKLTTEANTKYFFIFLPFLVKDVNSVLLELGPCGLVQERTRELARRGLVT